MKSYFSGDVSLLNLIDSLTEYFSELHRTLVFHLIFDVFFLERDVFNDFTVTMTEVEFENE